MNREMIKALLWKEWRETRWKWLAFYAAFHIPAIIGGMIFTFNSAVRFDVRVMNGSLATQYLHGFLLIQSGFVVTAGLFLIAFFAAGAVAPEIEGRQMFFLFERPIRRWQILLLKFLVGSVQAIVCVGFSIITTLSLAYFSMVIVASGVTLSGTWHEYTSIIASGLRGTLWAGVIGLMVFAATFVFSVLFEKWWVGVIAGAISLIGMFYFLGKSIFDWILTNVIRASAQQGGPNLELYAQIDPVPILTMLAVTVAFYLTAQAIFARKELK